MVMKIHNFGLMVLSSLSVVILAACGDSGSSNKADDSGYVEPPTTVTKTFPAQSATPSMQDINDAGSLLLNEEGLSLYTFDDDSENTSTCDGAPEDTSTCAGNWPPLLVAESAIEGNGFTFITRGDDQQWAYNSMPLYTYVGDSAQGDISGDGINDSWHLARPMPLALQDDEATPFYVGAQKALSVNSALESIRLEKTGLTLYTFDADPINATVCAGDCITAWPPLLADAGAKAEAPLSLIETTNGDMQWAYKSKALYFFFGDSNAGEVNGDEVGDVWHTATTEPAIQRTNVNGHFLSATGQVNALMPVNDSNSDFEIKPMDLDGYALYTFDHDSADKSVCIEDCLVNWPAFVPSEADTAVGDFTIFTRDDGVQQWAFKGQALYFFIGDNARNDINGEGLGNVWHLIKPEVIASMPPIVNNQSDTEFYVGQQTISSVKYNDDMLEAITLDKTGFTLYTFDNDPLNDTACAGACINAWPPLLADENAAAEAPLSIIETSNGHMQWAYKDKPLYFFVNDNAAGDVNGDEVGDIWHTATLEPAIQRTNVNGRFLSATGQANALVAVGGSNSDFEVKSIDVDGFALYTFDPDQNDQSSCSGDCLVNWPAFVPGDEESAIGDFTIFTRTDGVKQWAYKGKALYFFIGDSARNDINGEGIGGIWHLIKGEEDEEYVSDGY